MARIVIGLQRSDLPDDCHDVEQLLWCEGGLDLALDELLARPGVPGPEDVRLMVREWYSLPGNSCGGSLHIVTDDYNLADEDVAFCRKWAADKGDTRGVKMADLLLRVPEEQRAVYLRGE